MTSDDLNYADIAAEASRDAALHGLLTSAAERDECLFVTIRDSQPQQDSPARREVTFWTSGTGAFLVDLDQQWSWQVTAYDRTDQIEAVHDIVQVARRYLSGAGEVTHTTRRRGRPTLVLDVDGDRIILQAQAGQSHSAATHITGT